MSRYYIIARIGDVIKCEKTFTTKREATNACARLTKKNARRIRNKNVC